jgi:hypothetical protein
MGLQMDTLMFITVIGVFWLTIYVIGPPLNLL